MADRINDVTRYNLWDGKEFFAGMERPFYKDKINGFMGSRLVKVLVGQRRSGKSFVLKQLMNHLVKSGVPSQNILFVSKEFLEFDFIGSYKEMEAFYQEYRSHFKPSGRVYLFIDEVQNISGWEKFVNSHSQDFTEECELFISGSNSQMLSSELATLLSGRYVEFHIFPFNYQEYTTIHQLPAGRTSYLRYLQDGGLPGLTELSSLEAKSQYVSSVKDTIMLRDIIQRKQMEQDAAKVRDAKLLDDIFIYLVNNASNMISVQNIIRFFKSRGRTVAYETVANYIRYIEETYLVHGVRQYRISGKEVAESPVKYYTNDTSFRNYLYPGVAYGVGYLMENVVYLELMRHGYNVYEGSLRNKEVDFVAIKRDRKIYIQCAYSVEDEETRHREYSSLMEIRDNFEKWVVTLDDIQYPLIEGIRHLRAWEMAELL